MAPSALTPKLPASSVLEATPLLSPGDAAAPTLPDLLCSGVLGTTTPCAGIEGSSPDLCSHHPPARVFHADRGNDFDVPVNKLSGCISLKEQPSELPSPPMHCLGKENQIQLRAHTRTHTHTYTQRYTLRHRCLRFCSLLTKNPCKPYPRGGGGSEPGAGVGGEVPPSWQRGSPTGRAP